MPEKVPVTSNQDTDECPFCFRNIQFTAYDAHVKECQKNVSRVVTETRAKSCKDGNDILAIMLGESLLRNVKVNSGKELGNV